MKASNIKGCRVKNLFSGILSSFHFITVPFSLYINLFNILSDLIRLQILKCLHNSLPESASVGKLLTRLSPDHVDDTRRYIYDTSLSSG